MYSCSNMYYHIIYVHRRIEEYFLEGLDTIMQNQTEYSIKIKFLKIAFERGAKRPYRMDEPPSPSKRTLSIQCCGLNICS